MQSFLVLSPGSFINEAGVEITIKSFARLYHKMTPKHQKRLKLVFIEEAKQISILEGQLSRNALDGVFQIINREEVSKVEKVYQQASLFLFPTRMKINKIIPEALSFGLPILTYEYPDVRTYLDNTCSILVRQQKHSDEYLIFADMLEMLYYDPEVRKLLARGAAYKYENELNWGLQKVRAASS